MDKQIENQISTAIREAVLLNLPILGELKAVLRRLDLMPTDEILEVASHAESFAIEHDVLGSADSEIMVSSLSPRGQFIARLQDSLNEDVMDEKAFMYQQLSIIELFDLYAGGAK